MSLADRRYSSGADRRNEPARTHEHGRGRLASRPTEIPPRGWVTGYEFERDDVEVALNVAAGWGETMTLFKFYVEQWASLRLGSSRLNAARPESFRSCWSSCMRLLPNGAARQPGRFGSIRDHNA
jgi:hypothetical protein